MGAWTRCQKCGTPIAIGRKCQTFNCKFQLWNVEIDNRPTVFKVYVDGGAFGPHMLKGWYYLNIHKVPHGPFESRKEAQQAAKEYAKNL